MFRRRLRAFVAAGFACAFLAISGLPARAQEGEAETEPAPLSATIAGGADPTSALTTQDPTIATDQLQLLVKPLTLEELQNEAAAWLILLKQKVSEISDTEIAIKRQNEAIGAEKDAANKVEEAQKKLEAAEKAQADAEPNSPEYEEAAKKVEEAREALQDAQTAIEEAVEAEEELQEDEALKGALEEAEESRNLEEAKKSLEDAKKKRDDLEAGSPAYDKASDKIDQLDAAIEAVEAAIEDRDSTVPDSSEYKEATKQLDRARADLDKAKAEIAAVTGEAVEEEKSDASKEDLEATVSDLEGAESDADVKDLDSAESDETEEKLEEAAEKLDESAAAEAELKNQLVANVTALQGEQAGLVDRFRIVLDELENKGGDAESYRKYIQAISAITIDVKDTTGLGVRLVSWLKSEEGGIRWGIKLATFLLIVIAGVIASRILEQVTKRLLTRIGGTSSLFRNFVAMLVKRGVVVIGFLLALTSLGISLGPVLALVGGASFVLAFALQSNLGNFASGLMLLVNKPFDVGDEVKVAGYWAYVDSISLASTKLQDFSGSIITLPNNTVWGGDITNYTHADIRKLSIPIHVKFTQDLDQVMSMWKDLAASHPAVLKDPGPSCFPWNAHYEYYVWVGLMAWTKTDGYWNVYLDLLLQLQKRLQELNIEMAVPSQEIALLPSSNGEIPTGAIMPDVPATLGDKVG